MSRTLVVTARAEADLREIWRWSDATFGKTRADQYLDVLEQGARECARSPAKGRNRDALRRGYRSRLAGKHLLFYTFSDTEVVIQRVLHGGMDHRRRI